MAKISSISNFRNLPGALIIALSVISALYCVELFILPINFFTFRVWEALLADKFLPGKFYPNMKISMTEVGDLGHHTKYAVPEHVRWETDRYGFRKADTGKGGYRIVIVGDSAADGVGLDQKDMLSEVLERRLNAGVYPFTEENFLSTKRFIDDPPEIVILESIERFIPKLRGISPREGRQNGFAHFKERLSAFWGAHYRLAMALDRICKNNMARYIANRADFIVKYPVYFISGRDWMPPETVQSRIDKKMLFLKSTVDEMASDKGVSYELMDRIIGAITVYEKICKQRGVRFIFLPLPDKESIYYGYLPEKNRKRSKFLEELVLKLQDRGIEVIDVPKALNEMYLRQGVLLFHTDDTHLNADGVKIVADLVEKKLKKAAPGVI